MTELHVWPFTVDFYPLSHKNKLDFMTEKCKKQYKSIFSGHKFIKISYANNEIVQSATYCMPSRTRLVPNLTDIYMASKKIGTPRKTSFFEINFIFFLVTN